MLYRFWIIAMAVWYLNASWAGRPFEEATKNKQRNPRVRGAIYHK